MTPFDRVGKVRHGYSGLPLSLNDTDRMICITDWMQQ